LYARRVRGLFRRALLLRPWRHPIINNRASDLRKTLHPNTSVEFMLKII
jgi:hypothetical protein